MHNKKIITKGLIVSILLLNAPTDAMADVIEDYKLSVVDKNEDNSLKENKFEEFFNNLFDKFKQPKEVIKVNKNIRVGTVHEVSIGDGEFVPNLDGNPQGYETIRVTTVGNKKLVEEDYDNLRRSGIPKVDLSNAYSEIIPKGAFLNATHLIEFKFPKGLKIIDGTYSKGAFEGCINLIGNLIIPDGVTEIDLYAFKDCSGLTGELIIPNSITEIDQYAFSGCSGFTGDLTIPDSVIKIGNYAFEECSGFNGNLILSNSLTKIEASVFSGCSGFNGNLIIPNSVIEIDNSAFEGCIGFTGDLIIPNSVTQIGSSAFEGCSGFNGNLTISNNITIIQRDTFKGCSGFIGDLIIPNGVTEIKVYAFEDCSGFNGNLIIPNSVIEIGDSAFKGCSNFTGNLIIPNSITKIGGSAFRGCSGFIGDLIIPDGVTEIDTNTFYGCSGFNGDLIIPDSVTSIGYSAFEGCAGFTGDLVIPDSVLNIGYSAFEGCSGFNGNLTISNSITEIYWNTFSGCSGFTGDLIIPSNVTLIDDYAFNGCSGFNGNLVMPNSINKIGDSAFQDCKEFVGDLIIPNNLTSIGNNSFNGCKGLTGDLIIPNSVTSISYSAFDNLNNVEGIIVKVNEDDIDINYKESIIKNLPNTTQTVIDLPYDFDISSTWMENTKRTIGKPSIKNIIEGEEVDINSGETGQKISLHIPATYEEEDIIVLKDGKPYELPDINEDKKYIFDETGTYEINITTTLGNVSNITFTVEDPRIEEAVSKAEESQNPTDIEEARDLVNSLPESMQKDDFQNRLDIISPNIEFETKNATANLDVYIKSENLLSLSLNTNSVTFEDFSGVEDDEKLNAITLTVNSSLPYDIKSYLPSEIVGSKYGESLNKEIFNIRANGQMDYQTFTDTETPLTLLSDQDTGNNNTHGIDLMLKSELAYKNDVYKATVKFEVEQK